jgi:hydrogenase expression/formation protein HypD
MALSLAERGCVVVTYGDMLRIPGAEARSSLLELKSRGARVEVVQSAARAIEIARADPDSQVVFLAVGFETTTPATAVALKEAARLGLANFSVLCLHKMVPPVMRVLCARPDLNVDGFILPGNVTVVAGLDGYAFLPELGKAASVAGFEPEEILAALVDLTRQVTTRRFRLSAYRLREVPRAGNPAARRLLEEVFKPCDGRWRGLGLIPGSGYQIRDAYSSFDAAKKFNLTPTPVKDDGCRCGEVLSGVLTPPECELYRTTCTPLTPAGPCMASSEGTCGAWYRGQ